MTERKHREARSHLLQDLEESILHSDATFTDTPLNAFVYGVIVGWYEQDNTHKRDIESIKQEFAERFGWTEADMKLIDDIRYFVECRKK
jgi:hypothetical protein